MNLKSIKVKGRQRLVKTFGKEQSGRILEDLSLQVKEDVEHFTEGCVKFGYVVLYGDAAMALFDLVGVHVDDDDVSVEVDFAATAS